MCLSSNLAGIVANKIEQSVYPHSEIESIERALSSFIHSMKGVLTNRAWNFDSTPDFATFDKQGLVEKLYF